MTRSAFSARSRLAQWRARLARGSSDRRRRADARWELATGSVGNGATGCARTWAVARRDGLRAHSTHHATACRHLGDPVDATPDRAANARDGPRQRGAVDATGTTATGRAPILGMPVYRSYSTSLRNRRLVFPPSTRGSSSAWATLAMASYSDRISTT